MRPSQILRFVAALFLMLLLLPSLASADVILGQAPKAPKYIPPRPTAPSPSDYSFNGGFNVNTDSREQVRDFYNAIYGTSDNIPMDSTADVPNCVAGQNSTEFLNAIQRRLNWFRAMAGVPANILFYPPYNAGSQTVAVMISANHTLNHDPPPTFLCYNESVHDFAGGNQAEGANGPGAVTDYIWDFGGNNNETGHRRWLLFPATTAMGSGDVPCSDGCTNAAANSIWVFDQSINDPRPATRQPFVSWPPEGYAPYQVTYPYWSFALSNADVSMATVTMTSNGVPISVAVQPQVNGYGENTLVWVPMGLDASCECTVFPFNGSDTTYEVTVSNINIAMDGTTNDISMSYHVMVFDPAVQGADYIAPTVNGPAQPVVNASNIYSVTAINNPNVTSYKWITAQTTSGNEVDEATDSALTNFIFSPTPDYPTIDEAPDGSGDSCFHLTHDMSGSQFMQFNEALLPATNTTLSFDSLVGVATSDESARVQVSTNSGATWDDVFVEVGCNTGGQCESTFTPYSVSLAAYANIPSLLRFNWAFNGGSFYPETDSGVGWSLENIVLTNTSQVINEQTNLVATTNVVSGYLDDDANDGLANFTFSPATDYSIITNAPDGSDNNCFHLCDDNATSQFLQLKETLVPQTNTMLFFDSDLGVSSSDESAHVQVSTDNGTNWQDIYEQTGCNAQCESSFTTHALSLGSFAGEQTLLRFAYEFFGGSYYPGQNANYDGWCLENIIITNSQQLQVTLLDTTNFTFVPKQPGGYFLQAIPVIFTEFPLSTGPIKTVAAVMGVSSGSITLKPPVVSGTSVQLNFTVTGGLSGVFNLLQTDQLGSAWTTNSTAILTTNTPGSSYRFTTTSSATARFYRVMLAP